MSKKIAAPAVVRRWWDSLASEIPSALPVDARADWRTLQRREARKRARAGEPGDHNERAAAAANALHTGMLEALRVVAAGWSTYSHGSDDDTVKRHGDTLAQWFDKKFARFKVTGDAEVLDSLRAEGDALADLHGVMRAQSTQRKKDGTENVAAVVARYACGRWWRRRLRQAQRQVIEREKIAQGLVGKFRQVYCSDVQVRLRGAQLHRNREMLEVVRAVNDEGQEYTLQELADLSVSNPRIRRSELMVRMRGFDDYAKRRRHVALAVTVTCPSKMHPSSHKYADVSPMAAARHLSGKVWPRVRSCLARYGVRIYGFRVAEPHQDGAPHWHMVIFCESEEAARRFEFALMWYALQVDGDEKGGADHRVKVERITSNATGYLAKYISKGIDGWHEGPAADLFDAEGRPVGYAHHDENPVTGAREVTGNSVDMSRRVQAWATCHRVRQFQQIGGPPVTLWREARRVDGYLKDWDAAEPLAAGPVRSYFAEVARIAGNAEALRAAADGSDWAGFCEVWARWHGAMAGGATPNVPRRWQLARPVYWCADRVVGGETVPRTATQYGDARNGQVCGMTLVGEFVPTRWRAWDVRCSGSAFESRVAAALAFACEEFARSRRTVNNCTPEEARKRAQLAAVRMMREASAAGFVSAAPS